MIESNHFSNTINKISKYLLYFVILLFILEFLTTTSNVQFNHVVDAIGYYYFSQIPIFDSDFWFGMRPVGYPLFIKLLDSNPNLVVAAQTFIHLFSWSFFAIYLYSRTKNKLFGLFSGINLLFIVIQPSISAWTHHVLTESLTFTLIAWIFMFLYEFLQSQKKRYLYFLLLLLFYYSTIRDVNAYYVISFIIVFSVFFYFKYITTYTFIFASSILLFAFLFSDYTANNSRDTISDKSLTFQVNGETIAYRWLFPYMNLVGHRFLTNVELLDYMKKEGMPVNNTLLTFKNIWGQPAWYSNPNLKRFREWVARYGKTKYMEFLITHPSYTFGQIYLNRHQIYHYNKKEKTWYYLKGYKTDNIFSYTSVSNITFYKYLFLLISIVVFLSVVLKRIIFNVRTITIFILFLPIGLLSILTYHGDAMNVFRHTLIIPTLLKITMFMLIYVLGNELISKKYKIKNMKKTI